MTDHEHRDPDEIDFVVGSSADDAVDELLDTGPPRHTDRRLLITLGVAALAIVAVVVALRGSASPHPTSAPSDSASVAPTGPALPSVGDDKPAPGNSITYTEVSLDKNLCVAHRTCFPIATPRSVQAKVRAAIGHAFGPVTKLKIRNSAIALDDPPRESLFARRITATTPDGRVEVLAAAVGRGSILTTSLVSGNSIGSEDSDGDYSLDGRIEGGLSIDPGTLANRLQHLLGDPRLVAKS